MAEPNKRFWHGTTYVPGEIVEHNGRCWLAMLRTAYAPGVGSGHWVVAHTPPGRRPRPAAAPRCAAPSPVAKTVFPSVAESQARARALIVDAVKRAGAAPASDAEEPFVFNGHVVDTLNDMIRAAFTAADRESRERDARLADELAEVRRHVETQVGRTRPG